MKIEYFYFRSLSLKKLFTLLLFLVSLSMTSQVGIGTVDPDASSILDIKSDTQGLLVPRMTTQERKDIVDAANSLLVYDKDGKSFFYFDSIPPNSKWIRISSDFQKRDNYKLVKSVVDFHH